MDQAMKFVQLHNRWGMFHFLFLFWLVKLFIIVTFSTTSSIWAIFITVSTLITRQGDYLVGPSCFSFQFLTRSGKGKLISVLHLFLTISQAFQRLRRIWFKHTISNAKSFHYFSLNTLPMMPLFLYLSNGTSFKKLTTLFC